MSNILVDGFGNYGIGLLAGNGNAIQLAMQGGAWAAVSLAGTAAISTLPWDVSNTDLYLKLGNNEFARRALPAPADPLMVSMYYASPTLASNNGRNYIFEFRDNANARIAMLSAESTGVLALYDHANSVMVQTAGPVLVASTAAQIECKINVSAGTFALYFNGTLVINATGLNFSPGGYTASSTAQFVIGSPGAFSIDQYYAHMILRNTSGGVNNTFPIGDRRVATLFVNADDIANQGWTPRFRKLFGTGIMDNRAVLNQSFGGPYSNTGLTAGASSSLDLGSADFTIEGQVRFNSLPTGSNKSVIFGKWDETNNRRSYQFYMGGPSLESGMTVFRISTDGSAGTVSEIFKYPWAPETDRWYHVAVVRVSAETLFFVDGVQLGLPATDGNTYFGGSAATTALGVQDDTGTAINNTNMDGFFDEVRITAGFARYSANFTPPAAAFPRGSGGDAHWSNVVWLSGFDSGLFDESGFARTLTSRNSAVAITPDDGVANYQTMSQIAPRDDTFIEAALLPATDIMTQTVLPTNNKTVTVGTYSLSNTTAVYTWKTTLTGAAFEVLIGASISAALSNLCAAINAGAGIGTLYGTGTVVNNDVSATQLPVNQFEVTALVPGTGGNSLTAASNDTNASWATATLAGGANIPAYSQFYFQRPPNLATLIDSVTFMTRTTKTDSGTCNVQASFVGAGGGVLNGTANPISTTVVYYSDLFEADPDGGALSPTSITGGRVRLNRTA